jgi:ribosomal protein L11 methyltransferase
VDATGWVRLIVTIPIEVAELVADLLWTLGAAAIEEQSTADGTRLLAGYETREVGDGALSAVLSAGWSGAVLVEVTDDGADGWRAHARAEQAGPWWIVPPWMDAPVASDDPGVLWVDPGRSFGSGSHPTTRLVLQELTAGLVDGASVLDVGCGSGVLSIASARLGAAQVTSIDVDPHAIAATVANAERNGVASAVRAAASPLAEVVARGDRFDVVLANLLAPIIVELADDLVASLAPGGTLIASGLLADRWEPTIAALAPLQVARTRTDEGWVGVVLR